MPTLRGDVLILVAAWVFAVALGIGTVVWMCKLE